MTDPAILLPALWQSVVKLDPRMMIRNPVMFVVEIVAALTTIIFIRDLVSGGQYVGFTIQIVLWLWVTVLFANFAEAVAEGRGKAQADTLRRARTETMAKLLTSPTGTAHRAIPAAQLKQGDIVFVDAGDLIPSDGEVIEGIASVDESAITGESAPVIRESGGDRSAVTGGTRVLSDWIKVRITAAQGSTFLDRMIALVEGAERQKTPNEIALNILLAGLTIIFVFAVATIPSFSHYAGGAVSVVILVALFVALIPTTIGALLSAIGIAGMDRLVRGGSRRRRRYPAAGQDRHHHAGQSPGHRIHSADGGKCPGPGRCRAARVPVRRNAGRPLDRRAGEGEIQSARARFGPDERALRAVHRADAAVGRRFRWVLDPQGRGRFGVGVCLR
jgi:K+-transporting ATPase ATPase B chain